MRGISQPEVDSGAGLREIW